MQVIINQDTILIFPETGAPVFFPKSSPIGIAIETNLEVFGEGSAELNTFLKKVVDQNSTFKEQLEAETDRITVVAKGSEESTEKVTLQDVFEAPVLEAKIDNKDLPGFLKEKVSQLLAKQLPVAPILAFWDNLSENPNENSKNCLFNFLEANQFTLTPDGHFIAYKKVTKMDDGTLMDSHSRTVNNNVGSIPTMDREKVNSNPNEVCSHGLHVGAWGYVNNFSGQVIIACKVNPKDVCAVPTDYQFQKMRTCRYEVLAEVTQPISKGMQLVKDDLTAVKEEVKFDQPRQNIAVQFDGMTARQIIDFVKKETGEEITISLKNKTSIIKAATKLLAAK